MYCYGCFKCWFSNTNVYYRSWNFCKSYFHRKKYLQSLLHDVSLWSFITNSLFVSGKWNWTQMVNFVDKRQWCWIETSVQLLLAKAVASNECSELHFLQQWKKDSILIFQPICSSGDRNTSFKVNASTSRGIKSASSVLPTFWNEVNSERKQFALAGANFSF